MAPYDTDCTAYMMLGTHWVQRNEALQQTLLACLPSSVVMTLLLELSGQR